MEPAPRTGEQGRPLVISLLLIVVLGIAQALVLHAACTFKPLKSNPSLSVAQLIRTCGSRPSRRRKLLRSVLIRADASPALVVVGSVNADTVLTVDRIPEGGETLAGTSLNTYPGGKGANQAAAAGRLGYRTFFLGQVGSDSNAAFLRESLEDAGVDLSHLKTVEGPSGTAFILLQPNGENSIIIIGGANTAAWDINDDAKQALQSAGAVLLQREIPEEINIAVAKLAQEAGVRVVLDCGGAESPLSPELLQNVTVLSPNETELARLTGKPTSSNPEVEAAARQLLSQGVREAVLVKRGAEGSLLVTAETSTPQDVFPVKKVVDTTGAGDCYTGAYAVAVLEGLPAAEALRFAAAASSLCVQKEGAMTSLPRRNEVDELL